MKDLDGKVAFVTGAASGIGAALAEELVAAGASVMIADIEADALEVALERLQGDGARAAAVVCDVSDPRAVEAAAEATIEAFGRVHVVCNNAGVIAGGAMEEIEPADWEWVLAVNLMGVVHGIRAFLPRIKAQGDGGHIVNTASGAGLFTPPMLGPYTASKFAVVGLSECLAAELHGSGIHVSVVCPSYVDTRIYDSGRNRQLRFGGIPEVRGDDERNPLSATVALLRSGMEPAAVARRVIEGVRADELYIFTHPEMRQMCRDRAARIERAFDRAERSQTLRGRPDRRT